MDLEKEELESLQKLVSGIEGSLDQATKTLLEKIKKPTQIQRSEKKIKATATATKHRSKQAQAKIANAVNILRMQNQKFTHYNIAKMAEVSYNTCRKYISDDYLDTLNS